MTRLRIWSDRPHLPLVQAIEQAPWRNAAGVDVVDDAPDVTLVVLDTDESPADWSFANHRDVDLTGPVLFVGPGVAEDGQTSPAHDIRLRAGAIGEQHDVVIHDRLLAIPTHYASDTPLITANIGYRDLPVAASAPGQLGTVLATGILPTTWEKPAFLRLIHRLLHHVSHRNVAPAVRVGLLGYGAIGHEHAAAINTVPGLELAMVCDTQSARLDAAEQFTPGVRVTVDPEHLVTADDVDLIVVSTPPSTHADWALRVLNAGKHVVLEKPMALTSAECDAVIDRAQQLNLLAVVYQNRRYDPDFLAIAQLIASDDLGDVFHLESFVGTHQHPCNYWHSDRDVSGGALFDWGSHVVDQILQLMPGDIEYVTAMNHKRRWHDVTNADHARMTLHYSDGREATFVYSDLAAALKPRWYLTGTKGGIIGDWRHESVLSRSAIGTLSEDVLAAADSPPVIRLFAEDGRVSVVPGVSPSPFAFHTELAAYLQHGFPMQVNADQSRRVVAMLEAAEASAVKDGRPVSPA